MQESLQGAEWSTAAEPIPGAPPTVPGPSGLFGMRLRQLGLLEVDDTQAESFWREVMHHRRAMEHRLGRDLGQRVALLDYIVNLQPQLFAPQAIERVGDASSDLSPVSDALTGLHNRFYFDLELRREAERCRRYGEPASLVLLDVDDFGVINERFGRAAGDEVLQAIAAVLLHHVRAPDVPCRYGADEFGILLPGTPQVEALSVAQRMCGGISSWFAENLAGLHRITVSASAGVASLPMEDCSMEALVREAGNALQDARHMGGHRVVAPIAGPRSVERRPGR